MTKRMLIDASHAEETRVVVLDGTRLEDFDVETSTKRQLKGNIYLAKVVRVEPSLQAAFVEYGGNRHGFLAFSEIHPDYYQIPIADRQRLIEMQAEEARREEEEEDLEMALSQGVVEPLPAVVAVAADDEPAAEAWALASTPHLLALAATAPTPAPTINQPVAADAPQGTEAWAKPDVPRLVAQRDDPPATSAQALEIEADSVVEEDGDADEPYDADGDAIEVLPPPETIGGGDQESSDDQRERRLPSRFLRNYKIQEVIRRRQILLVQVVKEERGTKGAALTTYLSLAGRFGVLMPNSPRGGGISRKITSATDRRRLKEVMAELDIPRGMGMIVRTAGANRPKPEIKRDCEYLLRLWDDIREHTMKSVAPALIYEEASLIKRAIRDVYSRDIDEILVDGEDGWRAAHDFMRMLMPSHAKKVQLWRDGGQPLFARNQVEAQLDGMLMPTVQLRSGGYLVINQAEALVAIDVNSGRSTRERNIEETALRTNLEAADEVARQLRLRDLAGLIVIDFIDMESKRHNAMVERRIKEALKNDRARIQVGHISHFGLLEMSRQRLRPSLAETSFIPCPHCGGTGHVRSTENAAIHVLRGIEDEGSKRRSAEIVVYVSTPVALYLLNHKRERLREIEIRYTMRVVIAADDQQIAPQFRIEKVRTRSPDEIPAVVSVERALPSSAELEDEEDEEAVGSEDDDDDSDEDAPEQRTADAADGTDETEAEAERRRKRRRRRRRGGRRDEPQADAAPEQASEPVAESAPVVAREQTDSAGRTAADHPGVAGEPTESSTTESGPTESDPTEPGPTDAGPTEPGPIEPNEAAQAGDDDPRNRRRGRRGGRRRRRDGDGDLGPLAVPGADQPELPPVYAGPTPADPFGGRAFDIFDVMDQVERAAEAAPAPRPQPAAEIVNSAPPEPTMPEPAMPEPAMPEPGVPEPAMPEPAMPEPGVANAEPEPPVAEQATVPEPETAVTAPEPEVVNGGAFEPAADTLHAGAEATALTPANDIGEQATLPEPPLPEPLVRPILIGADGEPPAERKRGWWRR
jgi:ribonuclease E